MTKSTSFIESFQFKKRLFYAFTIVVAIFTFYSTYELISSKYKIKQNSLFRLDTVVLQSKAYLLTNIGKSSHRGYDFQDTEWLSYRIDDPEYYAIKDLRLIDDTLQYHGIRFVVYTDKNGFVIHKNREKGKKIPVYQLSMGGEDYIDIDKSNSNSKKGRIKGLIFWIIIYSGAFAFYLYQKRRQQNSVGNT